MCVFFCEYFSSHSSRARARCELTGLGDSQVKGFLEFHQRTEDKPTTITGEISGLEPSSKHGLSIQVFGDLSDGFASMGGHFNPMGKNHGGPGDEERHVGSLGNIEADAEGVAKVLIEDKLVKLIGPYVSATLTKLPDFLLLSLIYAFLTLSLK